jgi:hypothetical protein
VIQNIGHRIGRNVLKPLTVDMHNGAELAMISAQISFQVNPVLQILMAEPGFDHIQSGAVSAGKTRASHADGNIDYVLSHDSGSFIT